MSSESPIEPDDKYKEAIDSDISGFESEWPYNNVTLEDRCKIHTLHDLVRLQKPGHAAMEQDIFGEGFGIIREISSAAALSVFETVRVEYIREAWVEGESAYRRAIDLFTRLEDSLGIGELRESKLD